MKNKLIVIALSGFAFAAAHADDKPLAVNDIPAEIKSYVAEHFAGVNIERASVDTDNNADDDKYEITLTGNIELDFADNFAVTDIDANAKLPDSVIPAKIAEYVSANYPNNVITDWSLDKNTQQVELDSNVELEFALDGAFIRIDD